MQEREQALNLDDLSNLFGAPANELEKICQSQVESDAFAYRAIESDELKGLLSKIEGTLSSQDLPSAGAGRQEDWERGWRENLEEFAKSENSNAEALTPKYYKKMVPVRLNRQYVMPLRENFVINVTRVFRTWIFKKYFADVDSIYEFGCGPAHHLVALAELFPAKKLFGLDWAKSSQEIIAILAQKNGLNIKGYNFNFFAPDKSIKMLPNSGVFTFGALEQVGGNHEAFIQYLLEQGPKICVNIEGLHELYDTTHLSDQLAERYHLKRNYLNGYLSRLRELEKEGKIEILKVHHQKFGNLYDDPHSYVVWRPAGKAH